MSNLRSLVWATCALVCLAGTAHAQSAVSAGATGGPVEISPFVSSASGDATGIGAAIRWPVLGRLGLEFDTEYRSGDAAGLTSSVHAVFDLPTFRRIRPYAAGGIGVERYGIADWFPTGMLVQHATTPFLNLGGGIRVPITDRWGFRADVRYSAPFADRAPERLRVFWGATVGLGGH